MAPLRSVTASGNPFGADPGADAQPVSLIGSGPAGPFVLAAQALAPVAVLPARGANLAIERQIALAWPGTVCLSGMPPELQRQLQDECHSESIVAVDTARSWVATRRASVLATLRTATIAFLTTTEAIELTGLGRFVLAGNYLRELGTPVVVITHGARGASLFAEGCRVKVPAFPVLDEVEATGAAGAFAGGFLGTVARTRGSLARDSLCAAMLAGAITASFAVEGAARASRADLACRYEQLVAMSTLPA